MRTRQKWALTSLGAALLAACGGGSLEIGVDVDSSGDRGSLLLNPPTSLSAVNAGQLQALLASSEQGKGILAVAGAPKCGVDFRYIEYGTVGGANERTTASGALMVPTGSDPACSGARPIVLYAHGTSVERGYNIAHVTDPARPGAAEGLLVAATYAAQGFIVVAPNYAGYDSSRLAYHPYLHAEQSAREMQDALTAARKAIPKVGVSDSGKLLLTGYSQGGHVAMATHRAMQAAGLPVTASAPLSGPYATAAFGDAIFYGNVNLGATVFAPMMILSYQKAYGNLYAQPSDVFAAPYASGIEGALPAAMSDTALFERGVLPLALFSHTPPVPALADITPPKQPSDLAPLFALGFGAQHLLQNTTRLAYLQDAGANPDGAVPQAGHGMPAAAPQNPLRKALKANDLRNWTPQRPVLLCGGNADPTVFYGVNTGLMHHLWSQPASPWAAMPGMVAVLDVDTAATGADDPFAAAKAGFAQAKAQTVAQGGSTELLKKYHGTLVPPFCNAAARGFFQKVLASGG